MTVHVVDEEGAFIGALPEASEKLGACSPTPRGWVLFRKRENTPTRSEAETAPNAAESAGGLELAEAESLDASTLRCLRNKLDADALRDLAAVQSTVLIYVRVE